MTENENIISVYEQSISDIEEIFQFSTQYDDYLSYVNAVTLVMKKASENLDLIDIQKEIFGYNRSFN